MRWLKAKPFISGFLLGILLCALGAALLPVFSKAREKGYGYSTLRAPFEETSVSLPDWLAKAEASVARRYLIWEGEIRLECEDVREAISQLRLIAKEMGGYVSAISEETSERRSATVTLRIPAPRFEEAMKRIEKLGKVLSKEANAQDVTEEFVDLEARLRNFRRMEERLLALLSRAGKVRELLEVEKELGRVRGEIERIEGRLRYLKHRVEFATLTVELIEASPRQPPLRSYDIGGVARKAVRALVITLRALLTSLIWLLIFGAIWIPLLVVFLALQKRRRT